MIELDGQEYQVQTASENATSMLEFINEYCAANDIRNSKDEVIYIAPKLTNPLYIILYGLGYLVSLLQLLIYNVGCAFSIPNASEKQLLNLCDIAGIKRGKATKTTLDVLIYATATGSCRIYTTDTVTIDSHVYQPSFDLEVQAGGVGHVVLVCNDEGSFTVSEDTINNFDTPIDNLRAFKQYASIPGNSEESISSLRERLQRRTTSGTQIDKAADAIRALEGVTLCNIFFNDSATSARTIDDITIQPRSALVLVQGYNNGIAQAFFQNCLCATTDAGTERTVKQVYTTHANQDFDCYIVSPRQSACRVVVYLGQTVTEAVQQEMKDSIMTLARTLTAGQAVTSAMILEKLEDYKLYTLLGATVGRSETLQSYQLVPNADELFVFTSESITIDLTGAE